MPQPKTQANSSLTGGANKPSFAVVQTGSANLATPAPPRARGEGRGLGVLAGFLARYILRASAEVRDLGAFGLITLGAMFTQVNVAHRVTRPLLRAQLARAGLWLLPMALFLSAALGLLVIGQTVSLLSRVGANDYLGTVMVTVVVRELGPLTTAFLVLAWTGTANVIELGTARATGEVEALEALRIDPIRYLVVPRVMGMALGIFSLTIYVILGALGSGYLWAFLQNVPLRPEEYFRQLAAALRWLDFVLLAAKTLLFGSIIAVVTCYQGLAHPLRLQDVARATVQAVVASVIGCVLLDALFVILYLVA